jgi:tetratricopeptide (TPR) repeat protein
MEFRARAYATSLANVLLHLDCHLAGAKERLGIDDREMLEAKLKVAEAYRAGEKFQIAAYLQAQVWETRRRTSPEKDFIRIKAALDYANSLQSLNRPDEARAVQEEVLRIIQANWKLGSEWVAYALLQLGESYYALGRFAEAEECHRSAIEGYRSLFGPDSEKALMVTSRLAKDLSAQEDFDQAIHLAEQSVAIASQALGTLDPVSVRLALSLALLKEQRRSARRRDWRP